MFLGKGFRVGRIAGIEISVDYSWFVIFGLFVFLLGGLYLPAVVQGIPPLSSWSAAVVIALLFFGSVLVHELSHSIVARRSGIPVNNITLFIFGGVSQLEDEPDSPWDEGKMAIAGPLASVGIAVVFFGLAVVAALLASPLWYAAFTYLWFINVVLAVFNMVPGFPLDGGRVFRAILWKITGNLRRSTRIASLTGQTFGWVLIVLGVGSLIFPPLRQFGSIWLALIGWFLVSAARSSYQQLLIKETLREVPIRDVMVQQGTAVPPEMTLEQLVTGYIMPGSASAFPVEEHGELLGMVTVEDVRAVPSTEWGSKQVRDVLHPAREEEVLHPNNDAWDAANRMARSAQEEILVTENGHAEGVVTRGSIMRWLQTHTRWATGEA